MMGDAVYRLSCSCNTPQTQWK